MTRLRFLIVSFLAFLGAMFGGEKQPPLTVAKYVVRSNPVYPQFGYVIIYRRNS